MFDYILNEDKTRCVARWLPQATKSKKKLTAGAIAGIVISCLIVVGVAIFITIYFLKIRKAATGNSESQQN